MPRATQHAFGNWALRPFQTLLDLLAAVGFGLLATAGQISLPIGLLFLIFFAPLFHPLFRKRFLLEQRIGNVLTWLYVPIFVLDVFLFSGSFVPATLHLILFVQLVKSYQPSDQDRDHFCLLILSFLEVLAASSLTIDLSFLVFFGIYLFLFLTALMVFEVRRSAKRMAVQNSTLDSHFPLHSDRSDLITLSKRKNTHAARSLALLSMGSLMAIMILGTGLFFAIPRFGSGYFHRAPRSNSLSGFSDRIRLGGIGAIQLDPVVVMRVRVKGDPTLLKAVKWRGVTLDYFDGTTWSKRARGPSVSYLLGREFRIQEGMAAGTTVEYQVWLEPSSTSYVFTAAQILHLRGALTPLIRDPADDSFTARPHPSSRLAYDGVSRLPQLGVLTQAADLSPAERQLYLQLPPLDPRLFDLAFNIVAGAGSDAERSNRIEKHLRENYSYSLDQDQLNSPQPLSAFLLQTHRGHCEYFASSMVVLLRALKIPARIVNGFQAGEYNEIGENFVVRGRDAHSWVEAWFQGSGWVSFDPTPHSSDAFRRSPLAAVLGNYLDAFELFWAEWVVGYDDVIRLSLFRDLQDKAAWLSWLGQRNLYRSLASIQSMMQAGFATTIGFSRKSPLWALIYIVAGGLLSALFVVMRRVGHKLWIKRSARGRADRLAIGVYKEFLDLAAAYGHPKPASCTPNEFAASFQTSVVWRHVQELTNVYHLLRYCPDLPDREEKV